MTKLGRNDSLNLNIGFRSCKEAKDLNQLSFEEWINGSGTSFEKTQKFWNLRAEEFSLSSKEKQKGMDEIYLYLKGKGLLVGTDSILDLGCGPGKHALSFAAEAKEVIGLDISDKMIEIAEIEKEKLQIKNVMFEVGIWENYDLKFKKWENQFDLVFASMTPAVNSRTALIKMIEASKRNCFMSGFVSRKDSIKDELWELIYNRKKDTSNDCKMLHAFNDLWRWEMYPEIVYKDKSWTREIPFDQAVEEYALIFEGNDLKIRDTIKKHLDYKQNEGIISEFMETKVAWLYWSVK